MKLIYSLLILLVIVSCAEDTSSESNITEPQKNKKSPTVEQMFTRQAEAELGIPANENYTSSIYIEELNGDDSLDYIFTVNRLEYALNKAIEKGNIAQRAEMGYTGKYNYFFYMDGATKEISAAIPVASSPHSPLEVSFENVKTEAYKDILVDFRIRNSKFRKYLSVTRKIPFETFEMMVFDGLGTAEAKAFSFEYGRGSYSLSKDILIYKAYMENIEINDPMDIYKANPKIESTGELDRLWFFNDNQNKYFTKK
ncbi:MAG: hypothetical protein MK105_12165 [Crocinitomicaceae bacterium]|nr:hypothetical protein [Crocinitomicaceae bacterium]